jgi:hypothetical protein
MYRVDLSAVVQGRDDNALLSNSEGIELPNRQDALLADNPERRCVATNSRGERCRKFVIMGSTVWRALHAGVQVAGALQFRADPNHLRGLHQRGRHRAAEPGTSGCCYRHGCAYSADGEVGS